MFRSDYFIGNTDMPPDSLGKLVIFWRPQTKLVLAQPL